MSNFRNKTPDKKRVDLIVPFYNPPLDWARRVINAKKEINLATPYYAYHLILINDGSTTDVDAGIDIIKTSLKDVSIISYRTNKGKGYAIKKGMSLSSAKFIIYTDVDFPYKISSIIKVTNAIVKSKYDLVIGVRDPQYFESLPYQRSFISMILKHINALFLGLPTIDTQAGLKGLNQRAKLQFLTTKSNRYLFDLESIKNAYKSSDLKISQQEITLRDDVMIPKMSIFRLLPEIVDLIRIVFISRK